VAFLCLESDHGVGHEMNSIWVGMFNVTGQAAILDGCAGAYLWIAAQATDAANFVARASHAMEELGLSVVEHGDVQEVENEDDLSESLWELIPEARSNYDSVVCGTWHTYDAQDS
jgi:hypothetical protein